MALVQALLFGMSLFALSHKYTLNRNSGNMVRNMENAMWGKQGTDEQLLQMYAKNQKSTHFQNYDGQFAMGRLSETC